MTKLITVMARSLTTCLAILAFTVQLAQSEDTITFGSILILSGEGASWGTASKNGISMAVDKINSEGGVLGKKLLVKYEDDQGDPKKTLAAFQSLVNVAGVKFIIGPTWTRLGLPLIQPATKNKILMISPSLGSPKFNEGSEFLFNTWPHDFITSEKLADYVFNKGHRNVAVIGAEDPWVKEQTEAFKIRFEKLGGKIAFLVEPDPSNKDVKTEALKISRTNVDALVSTTDGVIIGSLVAKTLKEMNVLLPIYSVTVDQAAIDASQGGFEGMEFLTFLTPSRAFKEAYEKKFGITIDIGADSAYDAVMMLRDAMLHSGSTDPVKVAETLSAVKSYEGVSGNLISDGKRGVTKGFQVMKVVNGKAQEL